MAKKQIVFKDWTCEARYRFYYNSRVAIQLYGAENGEPIATATVNLPELPLKEGQCFIKNYSENEGMVNALVAAGLVEEIEPFTYGPNRVDCSLCRLIPN